MKKFIMLLFIVLSTASCSLLPKINFDTPNTVPQSVDRSKVKDVCKGEATFSQEGTILSCTRGYMAYAEGYVKKERKMTFVERIKSFINNLVGWGFWGLVLLVIFVPGIAGVLIGKIVEGTIGITGKVLRSTVRGIQNTRKNGKNLDQALDSELDEKHKRYIRQIKDKENIK